jgi:hypothetical protein
VYRIIHLKNVRLLILCTAVIPCMQATRVGLVLMLLSVCTSACFSVMNELAFKLYSTSWMKMPCTELTFVSVAPDFHCRVKWFQKVKLAVALGRDVLMLSQT